MNKSDNRAHGTVLGAFRLYAVSPVVAIVGAVVLVADKQAVRVELWDAEPPAAYGEWDQVLAVVCDLADQVRLQSVTAAMSPDVLTLARPGPHHARVHEGGRAATAELAEGTFAEGVERWLIQLWPA
ncbi:hypothetical protein AB0383_32440 [Amycolatopsis sp. NPDC051373]|uniref:hypothetical protein n=1 Tax=Amycolatopsis sp. NPDC051373 TaxID=3155801 RepID=UPI00344F06AB